VITIRGYVRIKQPSVYMQIAVWLDDELPDVVEVPEEELTPEQKYLEKLMKQIPRPGKEGVR